VISLVLVLATSSWAQSPLDDLSNSVFGADSQLGSQLGWVQQGVKNVLGGVVGVDGKHKSCMQKSVCKLFVEEVIDVEERYDPYDRSIQLVPVVKQERGALRWLGDAIFNGIDNLRENIGPNLDDFSRRVAQRRQGAGPSAVSGAAALASGAAEAVSGLISQIPTKSVLHLLNFGTDFTDVMKRRGGVYPWFRSAGLGYFYGGDIKDRQDDGWKGVCAQLAPDCGDDVWDHLAYANEYDGGRIGRHSVEKIFGAEEVMDADGQRIAVDANDPLHITELEPNQLVSPEVFLCHAGKYLHQLNDKIDGDKKDEFSTRMGTNKTDTYEDHCAEIEHHDKEGDDDEEGDEGDEDDEGKDANELKPGETEIISARDSMHELPVLVFEGLPLPKPDQTEEMLVEAMLKVVNLPAATVRTAVRLPVKSKGKSLVLVEVDTLSHEDEILEDKNKVKAFWRRSRKQRNKSENPARLGIRRARYRELWKYLRFLMVERVEGSSSGNAPSKHPLGEVQVQVDGSESDLLLGDQLDVEIIDEKKKKKKRKGEEEEEVNHRTPRIFKLFQ